MTEKAPGDVTQLLVDWSQGDREALDRLMPVVYDELRRLARQQLRRERPDHTLQTTALVHEAYLRLVDQTRIDWHNSLQFYALAATQMRRILVDHARKRGVSKRGGDLMKLSLEEVPEISRGPTPDLVALDDALNALAQFDADLAKLVELRFFGGFRNEEIAQLLELSVPTITRRWRMAKAWLYRHLSAEESDEA